MSKYCQKLKINNKNSYDIFWQFLPPWFHKNAWIVMKPYKLFNINICNIYDNEHYYSKFGCLERPQKSYIFQALFDENLPPKDDVIYEIWWQLVVTLWTKGSEYLIGFSEFFWEHWEPDHNFHVAKIANFSNFWQCF